MKKLIIFLITLCVCAFAKAQLSDSIVRHYVVAIDGACPFYSDVLHSTYAKNKVEQTLKKMEFKKNDYLSIVTYQLDLSNPNFDSFAWSPYDNNNEKIHWRAVNECNLNLLGDWNNLVDQQKNRLKVSANRYSFQTGAKPFILKCLQNDSINGANETIILLVSDMEGNSVGNNWNSEWGTMLQQNVSISQHKEYVDNVIQSIFSSYNFLQVYIEGNKQIKLADGYRNKGIPYPYVIEVYRLKTTPLPLHAISSIPAQLPIKRVRGGYTFDLDITSHKNDYTVKKIELTIKKNGKKYQSLGACLDTRIDKSNLSEGDTVVLKAWVKYNDGTYNGLIINPYDSNYSDILTIKQAIIFKDDAKIYGVLPVYDMFWFFWHDDIQSIVIFWDVVIAVLLTLMIIYLIRLYIDKQTIFIPKDKDIKIKHE